jgi:ABC-type transport system involved in multi-copper enzyme maturation permease subunit
MISPILPIARNAFIESIRQPVFFVILLVSALLQVLNTWISGFTMGKNKVPGEVTGDDKMMLDVSLATVFVCGIILAAFIATATISREIDNKTILTVVSKPINRTSVILGKYLGVAGAMLVAIGIMIAFLLLGIRHGVLTTAADTIDQPVMTFGLGAIALSMLIAGAGNYMYDWSFAQTFSLLLLPLIWIAYLLVLLINPDWELQRLSTDFKPQIMLSCLSLATALLVMTAVATAASTRLGQVMTIVVCAVVFLAGLLSNYMIGRNVYNNERFGQVALAFSESGLDPYDFRREQVLELAAERRGITTEEFTERNLDPRNFVSMREVLAMGPIDESAWREVMLREPGSKMDIVLLGPPREEIEVGDSIYYGAATNGVGMITPPFEPLAEEVTPEENAREAPALVISRVDDIVITIQQVGSEALPLSRPPLPRDSLFLQRTEIRPVPLVAWSLIPNLQSFWLVDAITQNQPIPPRHIGLVLSYGFLQIVGFLSIAVILFQNRDVG